MLKKWLNALLTLLVLIAQPVLAAPSGTLTLPVNAAAYSAPASIPISVTAVPSSGATVTRVELWIGASFYGYWTTGPYFTQLLNVPQNSYTFSAKVYDSLGGVATTNAATVNVYAVDPANTAPTVKLAIPVNNAAYSAPVNILLGATASDNGSINRVEFFANDVYLGTVGYPYSSLWPNVSPGTYNITAKAYDNLGVATTSSANTVTVYAPSAANAAPSVTLASPANNAVYASPATVTMSVNATDSDGTINRVEFYAGSVLLGTSIGAPYNAFLNLGPGSYSLWARAYDNLGVYSSSNISNVSVVVNALPTATLTVPLSTGIYTALAPIKLTATATDSDGTIASVEFYSDGALVGSTSTGSGSSYSFNWTNATGGTHSIYAKAIDNLGGATASAPVNITVNATNTPPSVTLDYPVNATTWNVPGALIWLRALASDTETNGGITKVDFYANGAFVTTTSVLAPDGEYEYLWKDPPAGSYTITAQATDTAGAVTVSNARSILVNSAPSTSLSVQTPLLGYHAPASIVLNATASDPDTGDGIDRVAFYADGVYLGSKSTAPYTWTVNNVADGTHTYKVEAFDTRNGSTISNVVTISVAPALSPATYQYDEVGRLIGVQH